MLTREEVFDRLENSARLPQRPPYGHEILEMLDRHDNFDIRELSAVVEKNTDIASFFLRQAHKMLPAKLSVKDAILFLGAKSSRNVLIYYFVSLFHDKKQKSAARSFDIRHYWQHVLGTAIAAEQLLTLIGREDVFMLFTYGLLHDLGVEVLDACLPVEMDEIYGRLRAGTHQVIAEKEVLGGLTHADIGGWLCDKWGFPQEITQIVKYHHTPYLAPERTQDLYVLYVADSLSTLYYERLLDLKTRLYAIDERILKSLGLKKEDVEHIGKDLPANIEAFRERFMPY